MKKKILLFVFVLFSALSLTGCSNVHAKKPQYRVVTGVDISCRHRDVIIQRHYTDSEKMESVLNYLRFAVDGKKPERDPNSVDAEVFQIRVQLSDGQSHIYEQKDHRYFRKYQQGWTALDPMHAAKLYALLRQYENDDRVSFTQEKSGYAVHARIFLTYIPAFGGRRPTPLPRFRTVPHTSGRP